MNAKYKTLIKDTAIFAIGSLGSKVILFFLVPLYTNYLTTAEYGTADLVTTFTTLLFPFTAMAIEKAVIRFGMKADERKEDVLCTSFVVLLFSIALTFALIPLFAFYDPIAPWKYYLAVLVILSNITEIERAYLKVKNRNKAYSIIGIIQTAVLAGTNIIMLTVLHTGVQGYLVSNIAGLGFCAVVSFFASGIHKDIWKGRFNSLLLKRMITFSAPLIFSGISWWVMHSSDKVLIELLVGASALGLYTAATKIPSLINVITAIFNQAWTISSIREIETTKDNEFYSKTFNYHCFVLFGAGIAILAVIKPVMNIYVGEAFRESWIYTPFLLIAAMYYSIFAFCGTIYAALQQSINDMWTSVFAALLNIIVNYFFIVRIGSWGAVIGTVVSFCVFSVVRIVDIKRYIKFDIDILRFAINSALVITLASCVTIDFHIWGASAICISLFVVNNLKYLKMLKRVLLQKIHKH